MSSNVQAWRTPAIEPSGAYITSLLAVIQTCGWAWAGTALSSDAAISPRSPKIIRETSSLRTQEPIRRGFSFEQCGNGLPSQQTSVAMGPGPRAQLRTRPGRETLRRLRRFEQAAAAQQSVGFRFAAAECDIGILGVARA